MVVYVLLSAYPYEGCECLGVYASQEEALAAWEAWQCGGDLVLEERVVGASPQLLD